MSETADRTPEDRRWARRWSLHERRQGGDRRNDAYKSFARQLPEKFLEMQGPPRDRVLCLVSQYCRGCDESLQIDLAQALLPTLQAIVRLDGGVVTEEHRLACEAAVGRCVQQNELATGRWITACGDGAEQSESKLAE
jgi:hypothetical protein